LKKILHITPDFNYSCGRSKLVFLFLKYFGNSKNYETHFITNSGDSLGRLKSIPTLNYEIFNFTTEFKNIYQSRKFYKKLKNYIIKNEIKLIHTHHRYPEFLAYLISRGTNIKTVTTAHSLVKGKTRFSFKSDRIIAVSDSIKNMLTDTYKVPNEKITMLYNFLEPPYLTRQNIEIELKYKLGIPSDNKIILFLGRITKIKGVDVLIEASEKIRQNNKNIFTLIIGQLYDNSLTEILRNLPAEIKLLDVVKNPYPYYAIADLVVLPSRIDPFPYVMLEAGYMQKPFIGGNTGGIAEFIEDGKNGLLIDPENPQQLADKIMYLLNNPEIGQRLGQNLHEKVNRLCDFNNYFVELEKIYNSIFAEQ